MTRLQSLARCALGHRRFSSLPASSSSSSSSVAKKEKKELLEAQSREQKWSRPPPHYSIHGKNHDRYPAPHIVAETFENEALASGSGVRLYDYQKMGEIALSLKSIPERIAFVSPYERPWRQFEEVWHRSWQPKLFSPRKAWGIPSLPGYYDVLPFYQYITKTRLVRGTEAKKFLDNYYEGLVPPIDSLQVRTRESVATLLAAEHFDSPKERVDAILASLVDEGIASVAHNQSKFRDYRLAYSVKNESFWVRAGFRFLYDVEDVATGELAKERQRKKYIGDDRRKLGELAFVLRDELAAQLRTSTPLGPLFDLDDPQTKIPVFDKNVDVKEDVVFSPIIFNLRPDPDILWQCPGYMPESEETHKFVNLGVKSLPDLDARLTHWHLSQIPREDGPSELSRTVDDLFCASAISTLFATLNAQAHILGFTQYNEIDRPLVSQLIVSDGRRFAFAVGQLNTIAINIECDGFVNDRTNVCYVDGPYDLYPDPKASTLPEVLKEKETKEKNPEEETRQVLHRFMQILLKK